MFTKFVDNLKTVLSIFGDKTISSGNSDETRYARRSNQLSQHDVSRVYLRSNIIQRLVETIPALALECEIKINSDSEDKIDKDKLQKRFKDWNLKEKFYNATVSARIYRESYILMDINDGTASDKPINWEKCKGLNDLLFIEFGGLIVNWNSQDTERISYTVKKNKSEEIIIHPERVLLFPGKRITPKMQSYNAGSHQSLIESSVEAYNSYVNSLNEGNNLLVRLVTFVFKMGGLRDFLTLDPLEGIMHVQERLREHKSSIGGLGGLCIDKDSEEVDWVSYSLAGVPDIINKSKEFFIANTELTHDQIMNEGSHDTASELENKNTQAKVKTFIRENWTENLNTVCQIITCEFYTSKYDILFNLEIPEVSLSQLETVTAKYTQAQTDNIYYTMGILNQETLQESRFASTTPWEINLVNPGVFPELVKPTQIGTSNTDDPTQKQKKKTKTVKDSIDNNFLDSVTPVTTEFQLTSDNLEEILERVKSKSPLVFAFIEADIDNEKVE